MAGGGRGVWWAGGHTSKHWGCIGPKHAHMPDYNVLKHGDKPGPVVSAGGVHSWAPGYGEDEEITAWLEKIAVSEEPISPRREPVDMENMEILMGTMMRMVVTVKMASTMILTVLKTILIRTIMAKTLMTNLLSMDTKIMVKKTTVTKRTLTDPTNVFLTIKNFTFLMN